MLANSAAPCPHLPSSEATFCNSCWDVKCKDMWNERVNQPHIIFHLFSVQKRCGFCLHCAVIVMILLCWAYPWHTVRLWFGVLIHFLGSERANKKYGFLLHVVRVKNWTGLPLNYWTIENQSRIIWSCQIMCLVNRNYCFLVVLGHGEGNPSSK